MRTCGEELARRRLLDRAPGVHDDDLVGEAGGQPEVVADHHERHPELALQVAQQLHDLRLRGDVERGRRLVGDQQPRLGGQGDRDDHALAHAARELVRVLVQALLGEGRRTSLSSSSARSRAAPRSTRCVGADRLGDLRADAHRRVQRPRGVLEDHRDSRPRRRIALSESPSSSSPSKRTEPETVAVAGSRPMIARELTVLPEPDSPMSAERAPDRERVAEAVDRHGDARRGEVHAQVAHLEQRPTPARRRPRRGRRRGSAAHHDAFPRARSASPRRLKASTVTKRNALGQQHELAARPTARPGPSKIMLPQLGSGRRDAEAEEAQRALEDDRHARRQAARR
jgi:hypothetical protein